MSNLAMSWITESGPSSLLIKQIGGRELRIGNPNGYPAAPKSGSRNSAVVLELGNAALSACCANATNAPFGRR